MSTELAKTSAAEAFRARAADRFVDAANMSLHELVDEFQRLTTVMDDCTTVEDNYGRVLNEIGELASRERRIVNGAARARFGISFEPFDRRSSGDGYDSW